MSNQTPANVAQPIPAQFEPRSDPDSGLTQRDLKRLYRQLLEERRRVTHGMDRHMREATVATEVLTDDIDKAQHHSEQAYLLRFAGKERKLLIEIDGALERMRDGEYGVCEGTGDPIGIKRLELRPWTRFSVTYKEQLERERSQRPG